MATDLPSDPRHGPDCRALKTSNLRVSPRVRRQQHALAQSQRIPLRSPSVYARKDFGRRFGSASFAQTNNGSQCFGCRSGLSSAVRTVLRTGWDDGAGERGQAASSADENMSLMNAVLRKILKG